MTTIRIKFIYILFFLSLVSYFLYNFRFAQWFFLGLGVISLALFAAFLFYSIIEFIIDKEPIDLWKVGFLGLFGLLGVIPGFTPAFAMFSFFALLGSRNYY